ncbi:MAG: hypothetical protein U1E60_07180 [Reyranellaceae bacterium]
MANDLDEGSVFTEFQVSSWPPPVTQTLLRKRDGRQGLTIRAKPSGRLRVELVRQGYQPVVVRSKHLDIRTPALLRLNVVWRGMEAAIVANGQTIGTSGDVFPEGFVTPAEIQQTAALTDHVDNQRARASRLQRAELLRARPGEEMQIEASFAALAMTSRVVRDLAEMVREGRHHHLAGLTAELVRLIVGGQRDEPLLQRCAGLVDAPLPIYAPMAPPARDSDPATLLKSTFDVTAGRDDRHPLCVDLDVWLQHNVPCAGGQPVPITGLMVGLLGALHQPRLDPRPMSGFDRICNALGRDGSAIDALCVFALNMCQLARAVDEARREEGKENPPLEGADPTASFTVQVDAPARGAVSRQGT